LVQVVHFYFNFYRSLINSNNKFFFQILWSFLNSFLGVFANFFFSSNDEYEP